MDGTVRSSTVRNRTEGLFCFWSGAVRDHHRRSLFCSLGLPWEERWKALASEGGDRRTVKKTKTQEWAREAVEPERAVQRL